MNISLNQIEKHHESQQVNGYKAPVSGKDQKASHSQEVFSWDRSETGFMMQAYKDSDASSKENILEEASSFDAKSSKNRMVVMSNTMSEEDYKEFQKNGGNPGDYEPTDVVTIMDQIKITLAKSGVNIAGFTDQIDVATMKSAGVSDAYANSIAKALTENDLPATEDNIKEIATQLEQASQISNLSDGAKQYVIENELPITLDQIYKATYAGGKDAASAQGYYGAGSGYMVKKGAAKDLVGMEKQIEDVIKKAGMDVNDQTMKDATWLLEKGLPLTDKNLHVLSDLNTLSFPLQIDDVAMAAADAIRVGLQAKDGNLVGTYIDTAIEINEKTQSVTDDNLKEAIENGRNINLFTLFEISESAKKESSQINLSDAQEKTFIEAKKQLVNIQMQMSAQANLKLLKQGVSLDLEPLENLAKMLAKEESIFHATELNQVMEKAEEIKALPAEVIGISVKEAWMSNRVYTLDHVYEAGKGVAATYAKANQSYEALMTAPRSDLGDRIQNAFRNIDDLLSENDFELSDENRKAVRILGYNQMEINEDNMREVKAADAMLAKVLNHLTPHKVLNMIREGINPMTMNLDELSDYLGSMQDESDNLEKYSKYLYRLDTNKEISAEERDAYIGIYRLLRQIEKGDDAAIGAVVANNQEVNFENLLSAVRTRKKGFVDAKIDDAFGLVNEVKKNGTSITDQIMNYYQNRAGELADALSYEEASESEDMMEYFKDDLQFMREMGEISEDVFTELLEEGASVSANQLMAEQLLSSNESFMKDMRKLSMKEDQESKWKDDIQALADAFDEGQEKVENAYEEFSRNAKESFTRAGLESDSHIDIRSYAFDMKQISLWSNHAKNENYYVPMQLSEDSVAMVHVKIVNGDKKGTVTIDLKSMEEKIGKAKVAFTVKGDHIDGLVGASNPEDVDKYQKIAEKCAKLILEKTGKEADITCVQSSTMNLNSLQADGTKATNKELYQVAKAFLESIEQEVTGYES